MPPNARPWQKGFRALSAGPQSRRQSLANAKTTLAILTLGMFGLVRALGAHSRAAGPLAEAKKHASFVRVVGLTPRLVMCPVTCPGAAPEAPSCILHFPLTKASIVAFYFWDCGYLWLFALAFAL
ncbi:hypothetical protein CDD82_2961 [Ophiocordyceps australis]|uniref:Uncharacterized protein n=1 Tax=Ophiocordyceps australis TaxID=1399860 RepID=A0A2C5XDE5_9HYPO|nr:hypothetical protein CDD82_2961 [Ophiocordyceps australis]